MTVVKLLNLKIACHGSLGRVFLLGGPSENQGVAVTPNVVCVANSGLQQ